MTDQQFAELKWLLYAIVFGQFGIVLTIVVVAAAVRSRDLDQIYDAIKRTGDVRAEINVTRETTENELIKAVLMKLGKAE